MNKVLLIGRTTKDIDLRYTQSQKPVASFSLAVDRRGRDGGVDFFDCVAWNGTAEAMSNYVPKGSKIAVFGRLQTRSYENRDGINVRVVEVVAEDVEFIDTRRNGEATRSADPRPAQYVHPDDDELPL